MLPLYNPFGQVKTGMRQPQWQCQVMATLDKRSVSLGGVSQGPLSVASFWGVETDIKEQIISCVAELSIMATAAAQASREANVSKRRGIFSCFESYLMISTNRVMLFSTLSFLRWQPHLELFLVMLEGKKKK